MVTDRRLLWAIIALVIVLRLGAALYMGDQIEVLPGIHNQVSYNALTRSLLASICHSSCVACSYPSAIGGSVLCSTCADWFTS